MSAGLPGGARVSAGRCASWGLALTLLPAVMFAADAQLEAARQCTQLKDSLQRLVCYDKALMEPAPAAASAAPAAASRPAPVVSAPPVTVAVAPAAPAAAPSLGEESLKRSRKERATADEPSSLEAKVTAMRETRQDTFRISLDNGQVWQQMDMSTLFRAAVGDTVRIEKGTLGGFRMARVSNGHSGWVRVARLQ